jgi:mutator protein MutT
MDQQIKKFNIRVYGLAINDKNEILLTDEFRLGMRMSKFPGGGLEFGEGTRDCLRRECREELDQEIIITGHFYTTDYFQPTHLLNVPQQLLSIYYLMKLKNPEQLKTSKKPFDFEDVDGAQSFRWVKLEELDADDLTFPIDKKVLGMLKS